MSVFRKFAIVVSTVAVMLLGAITLTALDSLIAAPTATKEPAPTSKECGKPGCKCGCKCGITCSCITDPQSIGGIYSVEGKDIENAYTGACVIEPGRDVFFVSWILRGQAFSGIGIRTGDVLSVSWNTDKMRGVNVYKIDGKTLHGRWSVQPGSGRVMSETLRLLQPLAAVPEE